jgi:hypothetical protein
MVWFKGSASLGHSGCYHMNRFLENHAARFIQPGKHQKNAANIFRLITLDFPATKIA